MVAEPMAAELALTALAPAAPPA
ncbi:MAG: hypothetical protein JWO02_2104, partial [Solirubrobacterales bacterium]|nr:hypothetical protein [Solirubrobacterales bacterium]